MAYSLHISKRSWSHEWPLGNHWEYVSWCQRLLVRLCTPRAVSYAVSALKLLCIDINMNEVPLVSLLGSWVSAAKTGRIARYVYVTSTPEKPWGLGLQQDSLGRDISHMFLQFSAREKAHSMWPLKASEACTEPLRTLLHENIFSAALFWASQVSQW